MRVLLYLNIRERYYHLVITSYYHHKSWVMYVPLNMVGKARINFKQKGKGALNWIHLTVFVFLFNCLSWYTAIT